MRCDKIDEKSGERCLRQQGHKQRHVFLSDLSDDELPQRSGLIPCILLALAIEFAICVMALAFLKGGLW